MVTQPRFQGLFPGLQVREKALGTRLVVTNAWEYAVPGIWLVTQRTLLRLQTAKHRLQSVRELMVEKIKERNHGKPQPG